MKTDTLKSHISEYIFNKKLDKYRVSGQIKSFDDKFYSQFEGMYFMGLPMYYHLYRISMGKCYDASAALGLAFGESCYICRGTLKNLNPIYGEKFHHGWVEKDGIAYDTTWQISCPVEIYKKLFNPVGINRRSYKQFFEDCAEMSDWHIRDKKYYEENYSMDNLLIFQVRNLETLKLNDPDISENEKRFIKKLLADLPNEQKKWTYDENELE